MAAVDKPGCHWYIQELSTLEAGEDMKVDRAVCREELVGWAELCGQILLVWVQKSPLLPFYGHYNCYRLQRLERVD